MQIKQIPGSFLLPLWSDCREISAAAGAWGHELEQVTETRLFLLHCRGRLGSGVERSGEDPLSQTRQELRSSCILQVVLIQCTALTPWNSLSQSRGAITQNLKKLERTVLITKNYTKLLCK